MAKFPTYEEMGKKVAEEALDGFVYKGKTLREWIDILSSSENPNKCFDGMTNGEVIDLLFPGADIYHNRDFTLREMMFPDEWWNAPYKAESEDT